MKFAHEPVTVDLCEEMLPLLNLHYHEIAHYKDIPLDPNFPAYIELDKANALRVYTARDSDNRLTGYSIYFVRYNLHYSGSLQAIQDVLYIDPTQRGFGAKFIIWCDKQLAAEGVDVVYHHVKKAHDFSPLLKRMGYDEIESVWGRRLN